MVDIDTYINLDRCRLVKVGSLLTTDFPVYWLPLITYFILLYESDFSCAVRTLFRGWEIYPAHLIFDFMLLYRRKNDLIELFSLAVAVWIYMWFFFNCEIIPSMLKIYHLIGWNLIVIRASITHFCIGSYKIVWLRYSSHKQTHAHIYNNIQVSLPTTKGALRITTFFFSVFFFGIPTWMNVWLCYFSRSGRLAHVVDSLINASLEKKNTFSDCFFHFVNFLLLLQWDQSLEFCSFTCKSILIIADLMMNVLSHSKKDGVWIPGLCGLPVWSWYFLPVLCVASLQVLWLPRTAQKHDHETKCKL